MKVPSQALAGFDIEPHRAELAALLRLLSVGQGGFSLSIAVCNAPVLRDRLIEDVLHQFPAVKVLSIPAETVDVYGLVRDQVEITAASSLFLIGLEASISDSQRDQHTLRSLNASRDLWPNRFPMPVVFWLPEYAARTLSETARDFWRIRSHRFSFLIRDEVSAIRVSKTSHDGILVASLPEDEKLARIEELERRLTDVGERSSGLRPHVLAWLGELSELHRLLGNLKSAEEILQRALDISSRDAETADTAFALGSLGLIYHQRGELERAEHTLIKALAIYKKLSLQDEMASTYGNLGLVYCMQGDLEQAETMLQQSLAIQQKLGLRDYMANQYGNLGVIYLMRGDLARAEAMLQNALTINKELDRHEGMAKQYGNLGLIYRRQGDLDRAEEMHQKALAINQMLGSQESIAIQYGNLGSIAEDRGEVERARELWTKARDLFAKIAMPNNVEQVQGWLDGSPKPGAKSRRASGERGKGKAKKRKT